MFDTTLDAVALALRQERMRSLNVVADNDRIKELSAGLAGVMQIGMESESGRDGIQTSLALQTIRETVEPNDEDAVMPTMTKYQGREASPRTHLAVTFNLLNLRCDYRKFASSSPLAFPH